VGLQKHWRSNTKSAKFFRPSGKTLEINVPSSFYNSFVVVRYPPGQPEEATFVSIVESKQEINREFFQYHIAGSATSRKLCRGCGKTLDKGDLCIQTHLICILHILEIIESTKKFKMMITAIDNAVSSTIAFCLSESCLKDGLQRYKKQVCNAM
jgi:hypothetical protein